MVIWHKPFLVATMDLIKSQKHVLRLEGEGDGGSEPAMEPCKWFRKIFNADASIFIETAALEIFLNHLPITLLFKT